uniref:Uncharacterized protein n=1 Tax=Anguilla anguilla TaxID=7936 RepID=A0A0E9U0V2_ANGAN
MMSSPEIVSHWIIIVLLLLLVGVVVNKTSFIKSKTASNQ